MMKRIIPLLTAMTLCHLLPTSSLLGQGKSKTTLLASQAARNLSVPAVRPSKALERQEDSQTNLRYSMGLKESNIIKSYSVEVCYLKTVHIIFPAAIRYIDLGSPDIIGDKVEGVENILKVKANQKGFSETNLSVVTADGKYYSFLVNYSESPSLVNITLKEDDYSGMGSPASTMTNTGLNAAVKFDDVEMNDNELAYHAASVTKKGKKRKISKNLYDMVFSLQGIHIKGDALFFHVFIENKTNLSYEVDFVKFYIRDKKVARKTAVQEMEVNPLFVYNDGNRSIGGKSSTSKVFVLQKFTIPDKKILVVEMYEKNGGRQLSFEVKNKDILNASLIP